MLARLNIFRSPTCPIPRSFAVVCSALLGSCLGFLWWNAHPAHVFMGDTGLARHRRNARRRGYLLQAGDPSHHRRGVFVMEAMSVILQVASFKITGRRIIKMSPIHHHFELSGWKENTVIVRFWIMSILFALLGLGHP